MEDKVAIQRAVTVGGWRSKQELLHARSLALGRCSEGGTSCSGTVLGFGHDGVVAGATTAEVVTLEVARGLRKTEPIGEVVHDVVEVEKIRDYRGLLGARIDGRREGESEILIRGI